MRYAIIGGNNLEPLPIPYHEEAVSTPYGDVALYYGQLPDGNEVIFRPRQGILYNYDPADINYRANIYALYRIGVTHIVGIASVGACDCNFQLGSVCLMSDFIDFTKTRRATFDRKHRQYLHTGMEDVFSIKLNNALEKRIRARDMPYAGRVIYAATEGPRFETAAEVRMYRMMGAQVMGMTLVPEAPLARELGLHYTALGIICNYCTGMIPRVTDDGIDDVIQQTRQGVFELLFDLTREEL